MAAEVPQIPPAIVAGMDQRIAAGRDVLAHVAEGYVKMRKVVGEPQAVAILAHTLSDSLTNRESAIDLIVVAIMERADRQGEG